MTVLYLRIQIPTYYQFLIASVNRDRLPQMQWIGPISLAKGTCGLQNFSDNGLTYRTEHDGGAGSGSPDGDFHITAYSSTSNFLGLPRRSHDELALPSRMCTVYSKRQMTSSSEARK